MWRGSRAGGRAPAAARVKMASALLPRLALPAYNARAPPPPPPPPHTALPRAPTLCTLPSRAAVWTSTLQRTIITASGLPYPKVQWKALDEIQVGGGCPPACASERLAASVAARGLNASENSGRRYKLQPTMAACRLQAQRRTAVLRLCCACATPELPVLSVCCGAAAALTMPASCHPPLRAFTPHPRCRFAPSLLAGRHLRRHDIRGSCRGDAWRVCGAAQGQAAVQVGAVG